MCSRVTLRAPLDRLRDLFEFEDELDLKARFNVAPSQHLLTVSVDGADSADGPGSGGENEDPFPERGSSGRTQRTRRARLVRWGIRRPGHGKGYSAPIINARSETADTLPTFRDSFRERRCAVLVDGFYEWRQEGRTRQPWFFELTSDEPFAMAGIIDDGDSPGCAVLTTEANSVVQPIHDRMPVILPREALTVWLDPDRPLDDLKSILRPLPENALKKRRVSMRVNDVRKDGPELLGPPEQGSLF